LHRQNCLKGKKADLTVRFAVMGEEGRASSSWRLFASPHKGDVYIAPRSVVADLKASLHESGECRIGPNQQLRDGLFPFDRAAWTVWNVDPGLAGRVLLTLSFHREHLRKRELKSDVHLIPLLAGELAAHLHIVVGPPEFASSLAANSSLRIGKELLLDTGEVAWIVVQPSEPAEGLLAEVEAGLAGNYEQWVLPVSWDDNQFGWAVADNGTPIPAIFEFAHDGEVAPLHVPAALEAFPGRVRLWDELPSGPLLDEAACALLAVDEQDGGTLYVNHHSHCSHEHLLGDVLTTFAGLLSVGPDLGWDKVMFPDGEPRWVTGFAPPPPDAET